MSYDQRKPGKECSICHYIWNPRTKLKTPKQCPRPNGCGSRYWNVPNEISVKPIKPKRIRNRPYSKEAYRASIAKKKLIARDGLFCTRCWLATPSRKLRILGNKLLCATCYKKD